MNVAVDSPSRAIRLRRGAAVVAGPDGKTALTLGGTTIQLPHLAAGAGAALGELSHADLPELAAQRLVTDADGLGGVLRWQALLARLASIGLLERVALAGGIAIARLVPLVPERHPAPATPLLGRPVKLSRFAAVRPSGGRLVVERPGSTALVELEASAAGVLGPLADWTAGWDEVPGLPPDLVRAVVELLAAAGLLAPGGPDDDVEATDPVLGLWSPVDLLMHAAIRSPRLSPGYGGTYPGKGRFEPLPAVAPARSGRRIELVRPDLQLLAQDDPPLTEVLERRRSQRVHDDAAPITRDQLGELLFRVARTRAVFNGSDGQQVANRPYPAGGSLHELEIYPLVTRCDGLAPGLYHYAGADHHLEHVSDPSRATTALVAGARAAAVTDADPQVVLLVAARFGRLMWKYQTIPYSLVLKHVGVLYQTIYLVATAMGLAVCGLGGGDATEFAAATGLPYHAEGSVGELIVGSRATLPGGTE